MAAYACECPCLRCRTIGGPHHTIDSTGDLERTAAELADHLEPVCRERGRMLGIMVADGEWIVSLSSVASVSQEFVKAVLDFDPDMSPIAHDWSTVPKRSLGGHDLSAWLLPPSPTAPLKGFFKVLEPTAASTGTVAARSTLPLAGGPGCLCAAPKLISYLTQDAGAALLPPKSVALIELWCGADYYSRKHGQVAVSCQNCRRILPTLACRAPA